MHILFINRGMGIFRGGGENFDLSIARELEKSGCKVSFITGKPLLHAPKYPVKEFRTRYVSSPYLRKFWYNISTINSRIVNALAGRLNLLDVRLFEYGAYNILKKVKNVDLVQLCNMPLLGCKIKEKLEIPVVVRFPGPPHSLYKKEINQCNAIIASGASIEIIKGKIRKDVYDIPNGVDTKKFRKIRTNVRTKYGMQDNEILLLFVGRFVPAKNLDFLIRGFSKALKENKNIRLMLVGEGALEPKIKTLVKNFNISKKVIFIGHEKDVIKYYSAADIFILTSTFESFSIVTLEAMACELPAIVTKAGWLPNLIQNMEGGLIIKRDDIQELKQAILKLAANKKLREKMGLYNRKRVVENYDWKKSLKKLKMIYGKILEKSNKSKIEKKMVNKFNTSELYYHMIDDWHKKNDGAALEPEVMSLIKKNLKGNILDAGCGEGSVTEYFAKKKLRANFYGVDISQVGIKKAKLKEKDNLKFVNANLKKLPFPTGFFNTIYCQSVLEHVVEYENALKEFHRILKKRGRVIIRISNSGIEDKRLVTIIFNYIFSKNRRQIVNPSLKFTKNKRKGMRANFDVNLIPSDVLMKNLKKCGFKIKYFSTRRKSTLKKLKNIKNQSSLKKIMLNIIMNLPFFPFTHLGSTTIIMAQK